MSRRVVIVFASCFSLLALFTFARSSTFTVEKKELIKAPPETLFALVNDFKRWPEWSPWEVYDPKMKHTYEGAASGVGAKHLWSGSEEVGEGSMTITESRAPDRVVVDLTFIRPASAPGSMAFTFKPGPFGTEVSWEYTGHHTLSDRIASVVVDAKGFTGRELESGLAHLKELAQKLTPAAPPAAAPEADAGAPPEAPAADAGVGAP